MRRLTRRTSQIAALSALAVVAGGCASVSGAAPNADPSATVAQRNTTSPPSAGGSSAKGSTKPGTTPKSTPTPTQTPKPKTKQKSPFGGSVASYLASTHLYVTAAIYDRRTGNTFVFNPNPGVTMRTASIVKVEIMGTLFREHEADHEPLSASDESLLTTMIENSDNDSATALWDIGR